MIRNAGLSLILPPGLKPSNFANNRNRQSPSTRVNSTSGVLPIVERTPALLHITRYSLQKDGCTQDKSVPETSTVAQIAATLACSTDFLCADRRWIGLFNTNLINQCLGGGVFTGLHRSNFANLIRDACNFIVLGPEVWDLRRSR